MKGDDDASDVEECTTECEAEFMQEGYEKICEEGEPCGRSLVKGHESMGHLDEAWRASSYRGLNVCDISELK